MSDLKEQCMCKTATEACKMLKLAFGKEKMSRTSTSDLFSKFKSGMI
jgi:hypothetical protein